MNLLELFVKIGVKDEASDKVSSISSKLGSGLKTAAEIGVKAITVASTAIVGLTTLAVKNYAEYEQLVGGVETLFGESASKVMEYANNAYATAGMSANQYMELATSFSASLLQSLANDTAAAADYADIAMTDMADNANKMGTDMERITDAYQGFAKDNFTMLDNLKLGYGGTKGEMERLIADANKVKAANGEMADLSIDSFADMVEAIHIIQTEMGISGISAEEAAKLVKSGAMTQEEAYELMGTTAKEAATTIQGSLNMTKAAWSNLVTGIADSESDFGVLIDNFVISAGYAAQNLIPRIEIALVGVAKLIEELFPIIIAEIPAIIDNVLPKILSSAGNIVMTLINGLIEYAPQLMATAANLVGMLIQGLVVALPQLLTSITEMLLQISNQFSDPATLESFVSSAEQMIQSLVTGLVNAIPNLIEAAVRLISDLAIMLTDPTALSSIVDGAIQIIMALANGIINALPVLLEKAPIIIGNLVVAIITNLPKLLIAAVQLVVTLVKGIINNLPRLFTAAIQLVVTIISGIASKLGDLLKAGRNLVKKVADGFSEKVKDAINWGKDLIENFISGIKEKARKLKDTVKGLAQTVKDFLGFSEPKYGPLSNFHTYAPDMMELFAKGIRDNEHLVTDQINKSFDFGRKTIGFDFDANSNGVNLNTNGVSGGNNVSVVQNIYSKAQTAADLLQEAIYQQEKAVYLGV